MNKNPFGQLLAIFNRLAMPQKIMIGGVVVGTIVLLGVLVGILNEPNMTVLYTNLAEDDAAKVIDQLNSQKIAFKIEDNGKTIKVPQEVVYETRLSLAGKGIPNSGVVGYEIFDKNTMGMSEFIQKLNYKRAIEGELSRTIMQVEGVDAARVHIVIPEKSIFKDEEKKPTASIIVKLKSGSLSKENTVSILNLVASSVEGLQQNRITLMDSHGRLLSKNEDENSLIVATSKQYELKQSVERHLTNKIQGMLDNVLGVGTSIVQITADLNFDQVEKQMEQYDPDTQVAISEQTLSNENGGKSISDSTGHTSQNTTTNYEVSKTIQKVIEGTGNVKRLSIAAVINDVIKEVTQKDKKEKEIVYQPRSQEQLNKLEQIIKNAVGFDLSRGDNFSLVNFSFEQNSLKDFSTDEFKGDEGLIPKDMDKWTNLILILVAIAASLFVMKALMKRLKTEKIIVAPYYQEGYNDDVKLQPALDSGQGTMQMMQPKKRRAQLPVGDIEDEFSEEAMKKQAQQDKISHYVSKNPMEAAKLINSWLQEHEYQ